MNQNLSAISNYLTNLFKKTDQLEELEKRVNEMIMDEIIRDFTLHRTHKEITGRYYIYEVKEDDFEHIVEHLKAIQDIILPDLVVMAQKTSDECRIMFRVNEQEIDKQKQKNIYFERKR
jgi:hypothetical protein